MEINNEPEFGTVPVDRIVVDKRVQRGQLTQTVVNKMLAHFDGNALGTIVLSKRNKTDSYVVLDGMHRVEVVRLVKDGPTELHAKIFTDLTLAQEAYLFRLYNQRSSVNKVDAFNASVFEGDEESLHINEILTEFGLSVSNDSFKAIATAQRIVRRPNGFERFYDALDIIHRAWGTSGHTADGRMVEGLAEMLDHYEHLDIKGFVTRLAAFQEGEDGPVAEIVKKAAAYNKAARPPRFALAMQVVLLPIYNKGRKASGRLLPYAGDRKITGVRPEEPDDVDFDETETE